ncbi:ECF transporter S component, partial [Candidatus Bathyarchaeota archaeon]|nr:ECF transporter S component [Candidatus Bathyarchaeota archaeon]
IAIIVALCIGSNYALVSIPNLKAMDFFIFITGFIFGPLVGAAVGFLVWLIYGVLNPYGFVPQVWVATALSETIYGLVGGILGKWTASMEFNKNHLSLIVLLGVAGFFTTLIYDLLTNLAYAWAFNVPLIVALIAGIPFAIVHEVSNTLIFGVCSIPLIITLKKFIGGERFGVRK